MSRALQPVSINGIEFDALISEDYTLEADSPEYPVESGFTIGDSIIVKPQRLDMVLYLTNTPVTWLTRHASDPDRVSTVLSMLEELFYNRELVTITTNDKTYPNMAIMNLTLSKSKETGRAREIPISFKQVPITEQATTTIPASYGMSGATGANAGTANVTSSAGGSGGAGSGSSSTSKAQSESKSSILYGLGRSAGLL